MEKKMQIDQFAEFAAAVVQSLPRDMDATVGQGWITNRDALLKVLRQALMPTATQKSDSNLLTPVGTITVRSAMKLIPGQFFQVNTKKNAPVKISYVGDNFKAWFLPPSASEEAAPGDGPYRMPGVPNNKVVETTLRYHTLNRSSVDGPIIAELGSEAKAETTLAEIAACLQKQGSGEPGALLTNGYANIFYVRDASGVLRAVSVRWHGGGWRVDAHSVGHPRGWGAGYRVFSRDS